MKKLCPLFFSLLFLSAISKAQYVTIPDANFRAYLQQQYPSCFNTSGMMDTTCSAIVNETKLQVEDALDIDSLDGIQYFKSLTYLDCSRSRITSLPILPSSLTYLDCSEDDLLKHLSVLPGSLTYLDCSTTSITGLSILPSSLTYLDCSQNVALTNLPSLPISLTYLDCSMCPFNTLPDLPNTLTYLDCASNLTIQSMPVLPLSLKYWDCSNNVISGNIPSLPNSLTFLDCSQNNFSGSIPTLPNSLTFLDCSQNNFSGDMPTLPQSLDTLNFSYNGITSLPTLPSTLVYLTCSSNSINVLPILPGSLISLNCNSDGLTNLPILPASLTTLSCDGNGLAILPALPDSLIGLSCDGNQLTSLPALPKTLKTLYCAENRLTSLPALPPFLSNLTCSLNSLTSLPKLPISLIALGCSDNQLTSLPALPDSINQLQCQNNNIYCFPMIPTPIYGVTNINMDIHKIHCVPNFPPEVEIAGNDSLGNSFYYVLNNNPYPLCNPTNNINNCQSFPVMSGNIFYDNNSNGIKDPTELYMPYVQLKLSDGDYTYSNINGYYEIAATAYLGSYALSAYAPKYYKSVPVIMSYNFTTDDTLVTQDVAMQPTELIDLLSLSIYSYHRFARPGADFPVAVNYSNIGTTTLSPVITFNYDNTLLTYDSSSNPAVVNNGSTLSLSQSNFVPGQSGSFVAYFSVKTTDVLGDSLNAKATIAANSASSSDSINTIISSSFDPNEKDATPQLTPQQVASGKSINYTIRFQNTGNDTAFNIVIADTLSSLLQDSTLQMISSSNPCKVTVTGNVVYFEFLNVLLPDSGVNQLGSNGYVSFSVQPQTSVSSGSISNTASIYFDYNSPVVTNTATTLIQDPNVVVPVRLLSFNALTQANTNNVLLYWSTTSEINTKAFIVEQSTDGINFSGIATVAAKGFGSNSYSYSATQNTAVVYYRLKLIDNDGQYTYSKTFAITNAQLESFVVITNPAKDMISIKTNAPSLNNTTAKIINSEGAVVKNFILQQGLQTIDVSALANGFYYIKTDLITRKIMISR